MANGFFLHSPQFSATNGGHRRRTAMGLGNRCSILLSYGASGRFPRFSPFLRQTERAERAAEA
jgi:hypothetical protein